MARFNRVSISLGLILVLVGIAWAAQPFNMIWRSTELPPPTYLNSDLEGSPTISAPSIICAGAPATISISVNPKWNNGGIDSGTASGAVSRAQLLAASTSPNPYDVKWLSPAQSNAMYSYVHPIYGTPRYFRYTPTDDWGAFLSSQSIGAYPAYNTATYYKCPNNANAYFKDGADVSCNPAPSAPFSKYLAYSSLFCNAKANIQISGGVFSSSDDFYGSSISKTINLPLGQYSVSGQLAVQRCMASLKNDGSYTVKSIYVLIQDSYQPSFSAPNQTITVENPFTCSISANSGQITGTPNPGATAPFTFNLANGGIRELRVTSITLSSGSVFDNLAITSPSIPFNVPANNGQVPVSGTFHVPSSLAPGTYPLNLSVMAQTTSADCTGQNKTCNTPILFIVNVVVATGQKPDYIPILTPISGYVNENFTATITTRNQGNLACENQTQTNYEFNSGNYGFFSVRPLGVNDQQVNTTPFICPSTPGNYTLAAFADATNQCGESNESNNYASRLVECRARPPIIPVSCTLSTNHGADYLPGEAGNFTASCYDDRGRQANCTSFAWTSTKGTMNPSNTPANTWAPLSTFTAGASTGAGEVRATGATFSCNRSVNVFILPPILPDSCQLFPIGHNGNVTTGSSSQFAAVCKASGAITNCTQLSWATNVSEGSMVPGITPPLTPPNYPRSNLTIAPNAPVPQANKAVTASSASPIFSCGASVNVAAPPPSNIQITSCNFENNHGPIFFPGESEYARAICAIEGRITPCPNLTWSTVNLTQATLAPTLTTGEPHRSLFSVSLTAPPQSGGILVQCQNPASCINTCNAQVNVSRPPASMECYLLNHGPLFAPGDWSLVQANCLDDRGGVTECPQLNWITRNRHIDGSQFIPNPTNVSIKPTTNFSIDMTAPVPQYGVIDAVGTIPGSGTAITCSPAGINMSVVNIGPDYNLTLITHDPLIAIIGQPVKISVTTTNIGNQNATNTTTTKLTGEGCVEQFGTLQRLNVGETFTQSTFTCTCTKPGWNNINATVNIYQNQYETTYANNKMSSQYYCRTVAQMTCADFV